jgi:hypothetical protein
MKIEELEESFRLLFQWVREERYYGWDPYDGLNCRFAERIPAKLLKILFTQFNRASPVNARKLMNIEKGIDMKGLFLFMQAYAKMYDLTNDVLYKKEIFTLLPLMEQSSLRNKFGFDCWASHYFPYIATDGSKLGIESPDIIGTSQAIIALVDLFRQFRITKCRDMAISASNFMIRNLLGSCNSQKFFNYSLLENEKIVINASAQGLEALSACLQIEENHELKDIGLSITNFLKEHQSEDGSWIYSMYKGGKIRRQLDFHQGFILDGLLAFVPYSHNSERIFSIIKKGTDFYCNTMFSSNGISYYRYPNRYPIDIHNQAQGIITFAKLSSWNPKYLNRSLLIAEWTIKHMQDTSGYFYYQKWPIVTNQIPYMRWGQAWMTLALSNLIYYFKRK